MAIASWYASELPSISVGDHKHNNNQLSEKVNNNNNNDNQQPPVSNHNRRHRHHRKDQRRQTLSSVPNAVFIFIYRLWTNLCSCERNDAIDTSPVPTLTTSENGKPAIIAHNGNRQDHASDSEDELHPDTSYHSGLITRAFFPMRLVLMILGRWPFLLILKSVATTGRKKSQAHSKIINRIRVLNYNASLKSPIWIYFGLTTLFICFVLVMSTLGFFDFFLEWNFLPDHRWATIQKNTFRNNLVMFLLVWGCLLHSTVSSFSMFINRKRVTKALNFWNVAVEELQIGKLKGHRRFIITANFGYVFFLVLIYFAYSWWNIRFVRDGATLFGTLAIRPLLNEEQLNNTEEWKLRVFGIFMIIYCVYASRAFLFIFCFKCRILKTLFRLWNERLTKYLKKAANLAENGKYDYDEVLERKESSRLLRDMTILLKMVKQMDYVFATVLQSYYAIQLLNMCFELYMLAKSGTKEFVRSDESTRSLDIVSALITLAQNVYFFFTVSLDGASVGEEAAEGLHILKRHPISPHCNAYRKYLVYNLSFVYQHRIVLTGGKYFTINRPLIITVLGAVLTYFVIILQVEPSLNKE